MQNEAESKNLATSDTFVNSLGFAKAEKDTKVVVAMSGGVDSSVVACMLKQQGYEVIGVTLQLYDLGEVMKKKNACCAGVDIFDAKQVAWKFDFPHYVLNYQSRFKNAVIEEFADSYLRGETPIPCVSCNQTVKFNDLLKFAKELGADCLATGHYVKRVGTKNEATMHKATDSKKDQSYFLFATTKEQLKFLRFPLAENSKEQTRQMAESFGLAISQKPDSQDICFVVDGDYTKVVASIRPSAFKEGDVINIANNQKIGKHLGIINFTIGQRRGLGIAHPKPLFVVKIDAKANIVYVGEEHDLEKQQFLIKKCNWLGAEDWQSLINSTNKIKVRLRSNHCEEEAEIKFLANFEAIISMTKSTKAVTPGQACVFYQEDQVLGGGWITNEIH